MPKDGIQAKDAANIIRTTDFGGWSLCIGAGSSLPLFPTWQDLVQDLLTGGPSPLTKSEAKKIRESFPPEALIRASQEILGLDDASYRAHLTEKLYASLKREADALWPTVAKCLMARVPGNASAPEWKSFIQFAAKAQPSSLALADVVLESLANKKAPNAILSFNAEPLLFSLLNARAVIRFRKQKATHPQNDSENGPGIVDRVEGSTSWSKKGRIPYYFCHGFLPLPEPITKKVSGTPPAALFDSKMVFSETDYLDLANRVWSWQSSVFTRSAMSDRIVFVGLSLTDPNMRRWLAWIHGQRLHEIKARKPEVTQSTQHIWMNVASGSKAVDAWAEAVVSHLGVRLVWLKDWGQVGPTLKRMLNLPETKKARSK